MKSIAALLAVGAAAAATTATAAAPKVATAPGLAVSHAGSIYVEGSKIARGDQPTWSPDDKRIAFTRDGQVFVIDASGKNERRVVAKLPPGLHWPANSPAWSPDGKRLAFSGTRDVLPVDLATRRIVNLTRSQHSWQGNFSPAYSPDGKTIAFSRNTDAFNADIFLMQPNGKKMRRLTQTTGTHDEQGEEAMPSWSPDGRTLVYVSNRDGNFELYSIGVNGKNERRLTNTPDDEMWPRFSRDGKRILYVHGKQVAHMKADGTDVRELGAGNAADWR